VIAEIDEQDATQVAAIVYPARERHVLTYVA
jgi:hypothetical protein